MDLTLVTTGVVVAIILLAGWAVRAPRRRRRAGSPAQRSAVAQRLNGLHRFGGRQIEP